MTPPRLNLRIPPAFEFLFKPARYKVAWGGRGSAKSWSFADALIARAYTSKVRILCAREFQNSIRESVHQLLCEQIEAIGLADWFEIRETVITSHCGSEFLFSGIKSNVTKIKSMEGVDIAWVEEAEKASARSWEVLIPTIRKPGSEIWATFNPDQESDPTYRRFVVSPPPDAVVKKVSWRDNPWFPDELRREMEYLARVDVGAHAHVWEGECRIATAAQILSGKVSVHLFDVPNEPAERKRWDGPYYGADWGFSQDPTTLVKCWINDRRLFIEHEAYGVGIDIDKTPELFDRVPDARRHVIRADCARPETISYMQRHGYDRIVGVEKWAGSVEDGIAFLRQFEEIVIHPRCRHAIEEARLYSYKVDKISGDVMPDIVDSNNHCIAAGQLVTTARGDVPIENVVIGDSVMTRSGWRQVVDAWMASPARSLWAIEAGGKILHATPDHEVWTVERGFCRLDAIRYGEHILSWQSSKPVSTTGKFIGAIRKARAIATDLISSVLRPWGKPSFCTDGFTQTISVQYPTNGTCTTRTEIRETTRPKTLPVYRCLATLERIGLRNATPRSLSIWRGSTIWRKPGTARRKGNSYIGNWASRFIKTMSRFRSRASSAENCLSRVPSEIAEDFVRTHANRNGADFPVLTTNVGSVSVVDRNSQSIDTATFDFVPVRVDRVYQTESIAAVYDLAVFGNHEFVVGGILVSNCWDAIRYALTPMIRNVDTGLLLFMGQQVEAMNQPAGTQ